MKITLIMAGDEEGGLEKHVVELANGLVALGARVSVVAHEKYKNRVPQVDFVAVDLSKSRRNPFVLWQLYQAIKSTNPDVIHVHASKAVSMVAPLLSWLKIPAVATLHNAKRNISTFKKFDRVIAVSRRVAAQFDDQTCVRVVLNGIQPPMIQKPAINTSSNIVHCLAIGRLVHAKGFDVLIEAWQGINAELSIVGDGPDYAALQQRIQQLGLQDRISLLGFRSDITELLAASDCFVISSRNEGGPYTLSEALLVHCPVLSTDVGMVVEVVPAEYICQPNDVSALHDLLIKQLGRLDQIQQDFKAVYQLAQQQLTLEAMVQHTFNVYKELIPVQVANHV